MKGLAKYKEGIMKKHLSILVLITILSACTEPLPQDKLSYVGKWQSKDMDLLILADGSVKYKRVKGRSTTSIDGPLKEFEGDDFVVGALFMTATFDVSVPPREIDGVWKMTVDGVELSRVSD